MESLEQKLYRLLFFHFFLFFSVATSQILLGSKLSVTENTYWASANGDFALGFFNHSDEPNQYGVGIRFNSVSIPADKQFIAWVAGGDVIVGCNSYLHLTEAGDLVLFDYSKGVVAWTSNTSQFSVASASLLDNGNLVLLDADQLVVWQSFDTPSDTLLPGQKLTASQTLRAASRNSLSSYYSLSIDVFGQLRLVWEANVSYWKSEASSPLPIVAAIFTSDGALKLLDQGLKPVWSGFGDDHNDSSVGFRILRLDVDGNLRMYSWSEASESWRTVWQAVENQCDVFATCGSSGICALSPSGTTTCNCPFRSAAKSNSNCLALYKQSCDSGTAMVALKHTFLYGIYPPGDVITQANLEECRNTCLQDPLCTSVTVTNDGNAQCRMKQTQFITGYEHPSVPSISFVKMCLDPVAALPINLPKSLTPSQSPLPGRRHPFCAPCLIGVASGTLIVLFLIQVCVGLWFLKRRRRKASESKETITFFSLNSIGLISLSLSEIKDLTSNFKHQLGPNAYKGVLPCKQMVVIKDMKGTAERGSTIEDKHFRCWISFLGSIHHKNLLKLEAYCCNSEKRFLVYQLFKNGSVDKWIEEDKLSKRLTWRKRLEICIGVARAVDHLHSGCREFIAHGNLKWENVMLDEELDPKVTEYGLGRFVRSNPQSSWAAEEDVARFGEMIVMLMTGRGGGTEACRWAYEESAEGCNRTVVDSRMGGIVDVQELERTLRVAFWCVQDEEQLRPSMGEVLKVLEGKLTVDPPPPPFACLRPLGRESMFQIEHLP